MAALDGEQVRPRGMAEIVHVGAARIELAAGWRRIGSATTPGMGFSVWPSTSSRGIDSIRPTV